MMTIQMKAALEIDVRNSVQCFVEASGCLGAPRITNKVGLVNSLVAPIGSIMSGASTYGIDAGGLTFTIPVELHMLCKYTVFCDDDSRSVLDVLALSLGIDAGRILAEYPTADHARQVIDTVGDSLRDAKGAVKFFQAELAKAQSLLADERERYERVLADNSKLRARFDSDA